MARIYGLNGLIQGRQGNNVFSIQNGTQVLKKYNPSVANPRTEAQQLQRAKFALAGKLSGAAPNDALVGLVGSSNRSRRGDFVSRIVRAATSTLAGTGYQAQVAFADILFSVGSVPKWSVVYQMAAEFSASTIVTATVPPMSIAANAPAGYGEIVVVGIFDGSGSPLDNIQCALRGRTTASSFVFRLNARSACVVAAWSVPFVVDSRSAEMRVGNLGLTEGNDGALLSAPSRLVASSADFGTSTFNNLVLLQPANSVAPASTDDEDRLRSYVKKK